LLILPPRVEFYRNSMEMQGGQPAQVTEAMPGASEEAGRVLSSITAEVLQESGANVTTWEFVSAPQDEAAIARIESAIRKMYEQFDAHYLPQLVREPARGDYSLPNEAGLLAKLSNADAVVLIRGIGASRSGGARAMGAITSLGKGSKDEIEAYLAVVDGITGRLLGRTRLNTDTRVLNDADQLHKLLAAKMKDFPFLKQKPAEK
jgi:hypothetical protein